MSFFVLRNNSDDGLANGHDFMPPRSLNELLHTTTIREYLYCLYCTGLVANMYRVLESLKG